ncbi:MAG: DNA mismatch repair endonuclease MutL [Caldimicrobium sp.]|nr:DNA mismatch repair endonuclease MutL [Caldimicrobium sp.]MCX7874061.1 DNA mismatch repair endonuclease MutL [Caldimicrobium sp.]MDW8093885.1 DNA mismatch repair endonuclease MutL [Caldimicrobium sp.]
MPKILLLPEEVRNKIAAGEVIERPASVLKELLENAFDAKATFIKIEIQKAGLKSISVFDNGIGMTGEDLRICYFPFATSKIRDLEDLFNLQSYGFRGEALSSIAQVSRLKIISKCKEEELGHEILVEFGKEKVFKPLSFKEGTLVVVEDLFENVPARKAFLKSAKVESAKNIELLRTLMLTHPYIRYEVWIEGKKFYTWQGGSSKELFIHLFELKEESIMELIYEISPFKIYLLLTQPGEVFSHSKNLFFMVNNRAIRDEKLSRYFFSLLRRYYGVFGYPAGLINIEAPPRMVDFNVHPAKWEVRFKREGEVYQALEEALKLLFEKRRRTFCYRSAAYDANQKVKEDIPLEYSIQRESAYETRTMAKPLLESEVDFKILGSFKNTYLIVEREEELFIVDQHALSERICFEFLKKRPSSNLSQSLLLPFLIKLTSEMLENLENKLKVLAQLGFEVEPFGREELIVKGVPPQFREDAKEVLERLLSLPFISMQEAKEALYRELACILARKKGENLSQEERVFLIKRMFQEGLELCPHGRPLFVKITLRELEKKLKRIT